MSPREYAVAPLQKATVATLVALLALLPIGGLLAVVESDRAVEPLRLLQLVAVTILPAALLFPALRRRRVVFDGRTLTVKSAYHTRRRTVDELDLETARLVDLNDEKEFRPLWRRFGFGLVGFRAGHYRLRNWQKAFTLVTRREQVLMLPERNGSVILLSLERPQQLLDDLRKGVNPPSR